jgi:hypothetical protein
VGAGSAATAHPPRSTRRQLRAQVLAAAGPGVDTSYARPSADLAHRPLNRPVHAHCQRQAHGKARQGKAKAKARQGKARACVPGSTAQTSVAVRHVTQVKTNRPAPAALIAAVAAAQTTCRAPSPFMSLRVQQASPRAPARFHPPPPPHTHKHIYTCWPCPIEGPAAPLIVHCAVRPSEQQQQQQQHGTSCTPCTA